MPRANLALGYFLLEDLGDTTFSLALEQNDVDALYKEALDTLAVIRAIRAVESELPHYDQRSFSASWMSAQSGFFKALSLPSKRMRSRFLRS